MPRRSQENAIPWDDVERQYRLGRKSNKLLAAEFRVSESTIGRRAKRFGWKPDMSDAVTSRRSKILTHTEAKNAENATPKTWEIEVAARTEADLIRRHRSSLQRLTSIHEELSAELEQSSQTIVPSHEMKHPSLSLTERADVLKKLVDVDERLRRGECEAYGISAVRAPSSPMDALLLKVLALQAGQ